MNENTLTDTKDEIAAIFDILSRNGVDRAFVHFHGHSNHSNRSCFDDDTYIKGHEEIALVIEDNEECQAYYDHIESVIDAMEAMMLKDEWRRADEEYVYEADIIFDVAKREITLREQRPVIRKLTYSYENG